MAAKDDYKEMLKNMQGDRMSGAPYTGMGGKPVDTVGRDYARDYRGIAAGDHNDARDQNDIGPAARNGAGGGGVNVVDTSPRADDGRGSIFGNLPQLQVPEANRDLQLQYQNAMAALEAAKGKAPTYGSQYDAQIQSLYNQILGRNKFQYDSKTDPLYQQYAQDYVNQGKMAMRDTMGQAAALTGGYGSSYGQAVGQQQYDAYLQRMADILPQTYGMALDAYNAEGDQLQQQLATTMNLEQSDYGKYLDALSQYNRDLAYATDAEQSAYNRMINADNTAYNRALDAYDIASDEEKLRYARSQDYYDRLIGLMNMGYNPTAQEYEDAGLSPAQGALLRQQYLDSQKHSGSGGGSGSAEQEFLSAINGLMGGGSQSPGDTTVKPRSNQMPAPAVTEDAASTGSSTLSGGLANVGNWWKRFGNTSK